MKPITDYIKVAYAEDHIAVRDAMVSYLEKDESIKVTIVGDNGKELLERLILCDEMPDVCLIDIHMPQMNGIILLKEIRKRWPELPCLVLSGLIDEFYIINMIIAGANGYLLKTCTGKELVNAVKKTNSEGYYYNDFLNERMEKNVVEIKQKSHILNEREIQLLNSICSDSSYADIAKEWGTTYKTVDGIRERLMLKLRINSRVGLVLAAIRFGYYTIQVESFAEKN